MITFIDFENDFLIIAKKLCEINVDKYTLISDITERIGTPISDDWVEQAINHLRQQNFISQSNAFLAHSGVGAIGYGGGHYISNTIMMLPEGIQRAEKIAEERRPKKFIENIRTIPRSDWIAIIALIISVLSLVNTYISHPSRAVNNVQTH